MKKVHTSRDKGKNTSDSNTSDSSMDSEKFKETLRVKTLERKQRQMESKVEEQEKKLADFAAKLSARKSKVNKISLITDLRVFPSSSSLLTDIKWWSNNGCFFKRQEFRVHSKID